MKINILFDFKQTPYGGGNQFLKALKAYFISRSVYTDDVANSEVILFNSYQNISEVIRTKFCYPRKIFIHRVDGPIKLYNNMNDRRDNIVTMLNRTISDATIFQSNWSREQNMILGFPKTQFETVIPNAPDPAIFNRDGKVRFSVDRKIKLIATSWSPNWKKGFKIYSWLDQNLDFNRYDMAFIGRSPIKFKNIKYIAPLKSRELAVELKKNDIFIIASEKDPCSNCLIEALHCGLPAIVLNDGGHPEIIGRAGEIFQKFEEIPLLIKKIVNNYAFYQSNINLIYLDKIGERYFNFFEKVFQMHGNRHNRPKIISLIGSIKILKELFFWKFSEKVFVKKN
jgi:glycosyltransferase involved in cell wall biosynthesis